MNLIKKIICICISIVFLCAFVSCGDKNYADASIYYATSDDITTYDPQLANSSAELTLVKNCFEGLMTTDSKGKLIKGCAKSFEISNDKLKYTFKIKDGLFWQDGKTKVTAKDFAYGIKRAILPETKSPYSSKLYCIKNAKSMNEGKSDSSNLGISVNSNTITFILSQPDNNFLYTLSKALCMPCNQEFFESTNGRYGLDIDNILCNGSYFISSTSTKTVAVTLARNQNYTGSNSGVASYLSITYQSDDEDIQTMLENNNIDIGAIDCSLSDSFAKQNKDYKLFYNTNYVLYISPNLKNSDGIQLAKALMLDINASTIQSNLSNNYTLAKGIVPNTNYVNGEKYRNSVNEITSYGYNLNDAVKAFGNYTNSCEALSGIYIYYPKSNDKIALLANIIAQGWQKDLNAYINTKEVSEKEILSNVKSGEYSIAIIPISTLDNYALSSINILSSIDICSKVNNGNYSKLKSTIYNCEKNVVNNNIIYPLFSIPTCLSYDMNIKDISFSDSGSVIDFRYAKKP